MARRERARVGGVRRSARVEIQETPTFEWVSPSRADTLMLKDDSERGEFHDFTRAAMGVLKVVRKGGKRSLVFGPKGATVALSARQAAKLAAAIRSVWDYECDEASMRAGGVTIRAMQSSMHGYEAFWLTFGDKGLHMGTQHMEVAAAYIDEFAKSGSCANDVSPLDSCETVNAASLREQGIVVPRAPRAGE